MDDTPATTPSKPSVRMRPPSPASPRCKTEDDETMPSVDDKVVSFGAGRDSVFVHALPTTQVGADKPHQHAGSLTLSLPYNPAVAVASPQLRAMDIDLGATSASKGVKDSNVSTQMGTPVLQRRKHAGLPAGPHALAPLKLGADLMERGASNAAPYMQLSPMIEMDSPLLSPGLTLSLHTRGTDLPSPFIMGVGTLPDLEQPAPLDLPPAEGSTTPKASSPEIKIPDLPQPPVVMAKTEVIQETPAPKPPQVKTVEPTKEFAPKAEKPSTRRPALPPPRQIRFTTFTTPSVDTVEVKAPQQQQQPQQPQPEAIKKVADAIPSQQQQTVQHQPNAGASASPKSEVTPDLIHTGFASSDSASDSSSPMSQSDSTSTADAEVETILFGPPEKLDMHELDHAWGGSKAAQRRALRHSGRQDRCRHAVMGSFSFSFRFLTPLPLPSCTTVECQAALNIQILSWKPTCPRWRRVGQQSSVSQNRTDGPDPFFILLCPITCNNSVLLFLSTVSWSLSFWFVGIATDKKRMPSPPLLLLVNIEINSKPFFQLLWKQVHSSAL